MTGERPSALRAVVVGSLVPGTLDLPFAVLVYGYARGGSEEDVLHSIASGWLGRKAFAGGVPGAP
jgi:hypothetical protein